MYLLRQFPIDSCKVISDVKPKMQRAWRNIPSNFQQPNSTKMNCKKKSSSRSFKVCQLIQISCLLLMLLVATAMITRTWVRVLYWISLMCRATVYIHHKLTSTRMWVNWSRRHFYTKGVEEMHLPHHLKVPRLWVQNSSRSLRFPVSIPLGVASIDGNIKSKICSRRSSLGLRMKQLTLR